MYVCMYVCKMYLYLCMCSTACARAHSPSSSLQYLLLFYLFASLSFQRRRVTPMNAVASDHILVVSLPPTLPSFSLSSPRPLPTSSCHGELCSFFLLAFSSAAHPPNNLKSNPIRVNVSPRYPSFLPLLLDAIRSKANESSSTMKYHHVPWEQLDEFYRR